MKKVERYATPLVFPTGLAHIASMIKDDHEVNCWDPNVEENPMDAFPQLLEKLTPDVVGLSLRNVDSALSSINRWYYPTFVSMVKTIKEKLPHCKLVVGGAGFTLFAREVMERTPEIDFGVVTEGEHTFSKLLNNFDHPEKVNNLVFRKNGQLNFTEKRFEDVTSLPFQAIDLFDIKKYVSTPFAMNTLTKRGCSFNCMFCPNNVISGSDYRLRSPKKVVDEIEHFSNNYGVDNFFFVDSAFNFPFDHSRNVCHELIKRKLNISWAGDFHPAYTTKRYLEDAVKAGCDYFCFSPDGASDRVLQLLQKDMRVADIEKTISFFRNIDGAKVAYNFMKDLPWYNAEHIKGIARLIPKMLYNLREKLSFIELTKMRIYPYTKLYDISLQEGLLEPNDSIFYPIHYTATSRLSFENLFTNSLLFSYKRCRDVIRILH